ncbi:RnfH family protein [Varunaivibrio sulfuroxidans]|nr:RnfH family protein [Varunaivibrio sulfuroxidans]
MRAAAVNPIKPDARPARTRTVRPKPAHNIIHGGSLAMHVGVSYGQSFRQVWIKLDVPDGSTVGEAIVRSGILQKFPEIDLNTQKVGIFGKITKLDALLEEGARVEIYRPITADPEEVERRDRDKATGEISK